MPFPRSTSVSLLRRRRSRAAPRRYPPEPESARHDHRLLAPPKGAPKVSDTADLDKRLPQPSLNSVESLPVAAVSDRHDQHHGAPGATERSILRSALSASRDPGSGDIRRSARLELGWGGSSPPWSWCPGPVVRRSSAWSFATDRYRADGLTGIVPGAMEDGLDWVDFTADRHLDSSVQGDLGRRSWPRL
jgi:hypothetical protein